jgi:excisionase family DNA binding protein
MKATPTGLLLTVEQVAERLGLSEGHTRRLIKDSQIAHVRVGARAIRVAESDLNGYLARKRQAAGA